MKDPYSILGVSSDATDEEIKNAWLKLHPNDNNKHQAYYIVDDLADELDLTYNRGIDNYYDHYILGLPYHAMKADETRAQFEERIRTCLNKAFTVDKIDAHVDGGYEG